METGNEKQNVNVAEILRYAPKGLKLFSPLFGEVKFKEIDDDNCVVIDDKYNNHRWFYEHGTFFPSDENNFSEGECLLFPSASHRCWNHWQNTLFPESIGFVCVDTITGNKFILGEDGTYFGDGTGSQYSTLIDEDSGNYLLNSRYATPEEAKEFFEELNKNSYEWDGEKVVKNKKYYSTIFKNQGIESTDKKAGLSLEDKVSVLMDEINSIKQDIESLKVSRNQARMRIDSLENWAIENGNPDIFKKIVNLEKDVKALTNRLDAIAASLIRQKTFSCPDKAGDNVTLEEMKG